jgi:ribose 5-phosphate isomerase B
VESVKIAIGADHAGFQLKEKIIEHIKNKGIDVKDCGTYTEESCDYPVITQNVVKEILDENCNLGILVCGTGIGMSICANRFKGIRAALCGDTFSAHCSRSHNNANVLCLGARVTGCGLALDIVDNWLDSEFLGGRHQRRVDMIENLG